MRKFKLFSMLAMLLLCTAGMRAATEYGYGYFSARDKYPKASAEISFLNSQAQDEGKLPGAFSVSATKKVWFSQGNLQYQASTGTWRFAENQWDKYANASEGGNQTAEADRATQEKWIDLFGFGTSGYDGKNPYMCSTTENNYVHENISGTNYDWGANAISNGGNTANIWRTLTYEEMKYLISERPNATNLMAKATISYGGIFYSGCMFLPDEWAPNGVEVYNGKTYFDADWDILVKQGAVFLPGGGFREGTSVYFNSNSGSYWTGTFDNYDNAWDFYFSRNGNPYWEKSSIVRGASVRLVSEIPHSDPTEYAALVTAPTPISGLKYNGEEQAWVTPGTATGGAIFYRIDQDGEWSYQTPTSDKAGTHTIYYKVIGDATHLSPEGIFSFEVKIEKGDITVVDAANCIPGAFTISNSGRKVFFSKGNLQYNAAQGKWRFAENQWDTIGAANANISESYNGWIDLFGRGTSGYNNSYPYLSSTEAEDYAAGEGSYNLTGEYAKYDWGIYNTEQLGDGWHLNSAMEISYLLDERSDPDGESWSGEKMRAPASINGINGIILLPDGITNDTVGLENNGWDAQYSDNALTLEQWQQLEQKYYAVFLPATGKREGTTVSKVNEYAEYWENSYEDDINGHTIWVAADGSYSGGMTGFARGCAVRLTCDGLAPIAIKGLEYNGNDQVLIEPGYCAYGTFEYSLNGEAGPWITELPTGLKPGEYTVHYRVIGDESHNDLPYAANRHVVTTITGAAEIMPAAVEGLIYNGAPQTLCTAGEKEGFTFQYKVGEDGEWSTELPAETNAGTYTVYYKATNGNVEEDITGSFDVTIAKAEPTFTKPTATEPTYTGEPQKLANDGVSDDGTFRYSLDGENWFDTIPTATDAGDYTVYYRFEGDSNHVDVSDDAFQFTVTIAKGEPEFTAPLPNELTYSGAPQPLITAGTTNDGKLLYSLDGENWSDTIPTGADAGEYTVYYKVQGDKNHVDVPFDENNKVIVTIGKGVPEFTAPLPYDTLVYNGLQQVLSAAGETEHGVMLYSLNSKEGPWSEFMPQALNAGSDTIYYCVLGDENHLNSDTAYVITTIAKADPDYSAPTATTPTYSGKEQKLITAGVTEDGTFRYSLDSINWVDTIPVGVNAGEYTVYYQIQGDANHNDSKVEKVTATIAKGEPTFTKPTATEPTYTGEPQKLANDGVSDDGTFRYSLDGENWFDTIPTATDAGDYTVYYRFEGDSNHVDVSDDAFQFTVTIAKGEPEFTAPLPNELTYSGAPQPLITAGTTNDGKLLYSLDGENWSDTIPTGADAGEYTVYYKVQGDKNHVDVPFNENNKVIVTIAKADPRLTAPTDLSVVFNGSAQTLIAAGTTEDGTFEYSLDGENWSTDLPTAINVGTYTVYYRVIGDENHNDSAPATITATIVKEAPGYTAPTATEPTYSGAPQPLLTAGATEDGTFLYSLDGENWSTDIPTATNAGTYTVYYKVQGDADHRDSEPATITVTIAKATLSVEDVKVVIAKFADGDSTAAVTDNGKIIGVQGNDSIVLTTTASYDNAEVGENKTITVVYVLTADSATLANYEFPTDTEVYTHEGVIIEPMTPDQEAEPESEEKEVKEGIEINAFGFCHGEQYSLGYHLKSGNPNQYKITFSDSRFTPVPWTDLVINGTSGRDGYIDIDVPIDLPTGEYSMTVVFRDSIHFSDGTDMFLESQPFTTSFIVNLPETYTMPIFNDVIALVDTCHCLTDIQWYHRESPTDPWEPVPGATGYYLEKKGGLTGEYFAHVKMNGVETYTCPQTDVVTLYGDDTKVNVAPNPVISTATVTIENSKKTEHDLQITHLNGWIVEQNTFEGDRTTIDMSGCMVGQYMITVDGIVVKVIKK